MTDARLSRPPLGLERLVLTARDLEILKTIDSHRYVRGEHVQALHFPGATARAAQYRLAKLWHHGYLDRVYLASVVDGRRRPPRGLGTPVYTLGPKALPTLDGEGSAPPPTRELGSPATIQHTLVVTDFLVALETALRRRDDVRLAEGVHDAELWRRHAANRGSVNLGNRLVPDGAATFVRERATVPETYYLEVVRAGIKTGNGGLWDKLLRYADANHRGVFRTLYGHERVRAVLIATTSQERADHLRALARSLPHGRNLFAFGAYESRSEDGAVTSHFAVSRILALPWKTIDGSILRLGGDTPTSSPPSA